jgi:hypothetical protein
VRASDGIAGDDLVPLCNQVVDRDVKVGVGAAEHGEDLLQLLRAA